MADRGVRARRIAAGALVLGVAAWAVVQFGVPGWLSDERHPLRPVLEAASWVAGLLGLAVSVAALAVSTRGQRAGYRSGVLGASSVGQAGGAGAGSSGLVSGDPTAGGAVGDSVPGDSALGNDPVLGNDAVSGSRTVSGDSLAPGSGAALGNTMSGHVGGSVVQAHTITGAVTVTAPLPRWVLGAVGLVAVVVLGVAVLAVVVVTAPADEAELQAVVTVSPGKCAGGWVVPTPTGPIPLTDRPEGAIQADQGQVVLTLQGSVPAAVVLQSLRVEVVSRKPAASGVLLDTPCGADVTPRSFGVDLNKDNPSAVGLPGTEGGQTIPAPRFPFQVNESEVEQFVITPSVATDEVEWRLHLTWTSGTRRGETTIDDNGRPFRTTGTTAVTTNYCADLTAIEWTPNYLCLRLQSPTAAGFVGTWEGPGPITIAADGTAVWKTPTGEARIRLLSVIGYLATADVTASTTPELTPGDRIRFANNNNDLRAVTQLGKVLTWCKQGAVCR
ncbi:hypothetical protein [Actinokineospora terrae]|uniref:Uncharacterized protein n=1 Tax=Actinokineospora terrae TaxID=155974 RepID=A0A1H9MSL4_9PSEU|nr:hypothetical protein [Actinokineospora terrae]SER26477.1 hypothetical protein SAMN04487818_102304 [Actinokineospora terrae]